MGFSPTKTTLFLKPGREKSVLRGHPWVFSGAIDRLEGSPEPGETVAVRDHSGVFLAWAGYSPASSIRARVWSRAESETIDQEFFRRRIAAAVAMRAELGLPNAGNTACRLVFAESDGLPGVIVDRYGEQLVIQLLTTSADHHRQPLTAALQEATGLDRIYERSDVDVRHLEDLEPVHGALRGEAPGHACNILEDGLQFRVDVESGHKTGFYLDQRENRRRVRELAAGREVLNCFAYTGAFTAAALAGGAASALSIEASADAVAAGRAILEQNGFDPQRSAWQVGDVFVELRVLRDRARSFDLIVLDPPKFAATRSQIEGAARGYKDINLLAFKLLRPGGILVTFSCSGILDAALFRKIVAGAAVDAGVEAQVLAQLSQSPDHPIALAFPESEYLKGLVLRKMG